MINDKLTRELRKIDMSPVLAAYHALEAGIAWTDYGHKGRQVSLQHRAGDDPWTSSVGKSQGAEFDYDQINPYFMGTIFEELITEFKMTRTRLMWVGPYACYSMHRDYTPRVHVPMITNPEAYFVFKQGVIRHLAVGSVHWVDTRGFHSFMNCSDQHRLHLVGIVRE
jgi:hypothetical protein